MTVHRHKPYVIALVAILLLVFAAVTHTADAQSSKHGYIKVVRPKVPVDVPDAFLTFAVGKQLPLFQENKNYFIALVDTPGEGKILCAFEAKKGKGKVAWTSPEKDMYLGYNAQSCDGKFYLERKEKLPVLSKDEAGYEVTVTRFGREAALWLPKDNKGYVFVPPPGGEKKIATAKPPSARPVPKPKATTPKKREVTTAAEEQKAAPKKELTTRKRRIKKPAAAPAVIPAPVERAPKEVEAPPPEPEPIQEPAPQPEPALEPDPTPEPEVEPTPEPIALPEAVEDPIPVTAVAEEAAVITEPSAPEVEAVVEPAPEQTPETEEPTETDVAAQPEPILEPETLIEEALEKPAVAAERTEETADNAAAPVLAETAEEQPEVTEEAEPEVVAPIAEEEKAPERIFGEVEIFKIQGPLPGEEEVEEARWTMHVAVTEFILLAMLLFLIVYREIKARKDKEEIWSRMTQEGVPQLRTPMPTETQHADPVALSGLIGDVKLTMIARYLYAERETGRLSVTCEIEDHMGEMAFVSGQIVDAVLDDTFGEAAIYRIFALASGTFMFVRGDVKGIKKTVSTDTMSLLDGAQAAIDATPAEAPTATETPTEVPAEAPPEQPAPQEAVEAPQPEPAPKEVPPEEPALEKPATDEEPSEPWADELPPMPPPTK